MNRMRTLILCTLFAAAGCDDDGGNGVTQDMAMTPAADMAKPAEGDMAMTSCAPYTEDVSKCMPAATDYRPRVNMSKDDSWAACITDDNMEHLFGMSTPGSAARVLAWEMMAAKLWKNANAPSMNDFLDARTAYSTPNGLGSRVERRQDIHYPEVPNGDKFICQKDATIAMMYPDRCVGPAKLLPIITDAFQKGIAGDKPRFQSARIEAALLWFNYLSTLSEFWTSSFDKIEDIDSAWGYYNAAEQREGTKGLAGYYKAVGKETSDRVFDGLLAGRCWRDIDKMFPAGNLALYKQASDQFDKAQLRGLALVARERFVKLPCLKGEELEAQFEFLKLLVGWLDRESRVRNVANADVLKAQIGVASGDKVDVKKATDAIDALYPCP